MKAGEITGLLDRLDEPLTEEVRSQVEGRLAELMLDRLRRIAHAIAGPGKFDTSTPTDFANDVFLKLVRLRGKRWTGSEAFFNCAAATIRNELVSYHRHRAAGRRGGGKRGDSLELICDIIDSRASEAGRRVEIVGAFNQLEQRHPEAFKVCNYHAFVGFSLKEIGEQVLHVPVSRVRTLWKFAKAFLKTELRDGE